MKSETTTKSEGAGGVELENGRRSIENFLAPLCVLPGVAYQALGPFAVDETNYSVPRLSFQGPTGTDPIRIGIFAAIHGDEPAGAAAVAAFLEHLVKRPELAANFHLDLYPLCNPTGFEDNTRHSRRGKDLNREFWRQSAEAEVKVLEAELNSRHFSGIIQLHEDDTSDGIYGFVRGHTLTEKLLR